MSANQNPFVIEVDKRSAVPPYEQVRLQLLAVLTSGLLRPGDRFPSIRQLAKDLGLAPNTIERAFKELEAEGLIESRGPRGTFVREAIELGDRERRDRLEAAARGYFRIAQQLGFDGSSALDAARGAIEQHG